MIPIKKIDWKQSPDKLKKGDYLIVANVPGSRFDIMAPEEYSPKAYPTTIIEIKYFGGYYTAVTEHGTVNIRRDRLICKANITFDEYYYTYKKRN